MFDSREIGRKLDGSEEQPFLKIGITLESFNKEGNLPVENDKLTNPARGKDIRCYKFKNFGWNAIGSRTFRARHELN